MCASRGNTSGKISRDGFHEAAVAFVEDTPRADSGDDEAFLTYPTGSPYWKHDCLLRDLGEGATGQRWLTPV